MSTRLFPAKFNGSCAGCTEPIKKGDLIGYHGNNEKPTCEDCWEEGMPILPDPRYKQDYGLPKHVQEALDRRRNREANIYCMASEKKLLVHLPHRQTVAESYLREILGKRVQLSSSVCADGNIWWSVAKSHREDLTEGLQRIYKGVWVIRDYSTKQVCTGSCQRAEEDECKCSCGGQFHGGGGDWTYVKGDMLIGHEIRRITRYFSKETANV